LTQSPAFVLLHSPLLGPRTWRALAAQIAARGTAASVADFRAALGGSPPLYFRVAQCVVEQIESAGLKQDVVLVVHSGAGALVPAIARRSGQIRGAIFIDAILPHPGKCWFDIAPTALASRLRARAKAGKLPRWHRWWPKETLEALLPDSEMRDAVVAELHEVPLAYFEEAAPLGDVPSALQCFYLQLSETYAPEAESAARRGWRVNRLFLHHLAMLTDAAEVDASLRAFLEAT
jgi:pimeloyl-ACP methyl ester carboxylesterase